MRKYCENNDVRDAQRDMSMPIQELWLMVWQDRQGLGRNKIRQLATTRSRKEVYGRHFWMGTEYKDIHVPSEWSQGRILKFRGFGGPVRGSSRPPSPAALSSPNSLMNTVVMVARMEVCRWAHRRGFPLTKASLATAAANLLIASNYVMNLEADPPTVRPWDDHSPSQQLHCNLMIDLEMEAHS